MFQEGKTELTRAEEAPAARGGESGSIGVAKVGDPMTVDEAEGTTFTI